MKRILNYPGSKWSMADFIIEFMRTGYKKLDEYIDTGKSYKGFVVSRIVGD